MESSEGMDEQESAKLSEGIKRFDSFFGKYRNVIFVIVCLCAIAFFIYAWFNLQAVINDPCDICVNHTGATCTRIDYTFLNR